MGPLISPCHTCFDNLTPFHIRVNMHQLHTFLSSAVILFPGHGDIALYGPIYVTTACFHDGPAHTADESPLTGQCRNCKAASLSKNYAYLRIMTQNVTLLIFTLFTVHGSQHTYARSIYPSVCTHTDISCTHGGKAFLYSSHIKQ